MAPQWMRFRHTGWLFSLLLTLGLQGCLLTSNTLAPRHRQPLKTPDSYDVISLKLDAPSSPKARTSRNMDLQGNNRDLQGLYPNDVLNVVNNYNYNVRKRLAQDFKAAELPYPPARLALLAFKKERRLELWGGTHTGPMKWIKRYPFTAFSGELGPKRMQGDRQIPEGIYRITFLNPNSSYHLSMKLDYPNEFDRAVALMDHRADLGGDIFIHGEEYSIGCIALGNRAIEELFVLTAWAGMENVQVIVAPYDLRRHKEIKPLDEIPWTKELYTRIKLSLLAFNKPS
ncbi:MAG: L,D-transpeptidase family protein [Magnetococcus sp. YQC-5]